MPSETLSIAITRRPAWTKGRIVGQKRPLAPEHVWPIGVPLEMADNKGDLALLNTTIRSKLTVKLQTIQNVAWAISVRRHNLKP